MSFKNQIKLLLAAAALLTFNAAQAGNEGVFFYYGAGLGAMAIDEKAGTTGFDVAGTGSVFLGIEEDGWALEYAGFQTLETGTDINNLEYKVTGSLISLGYRTVEKSGSYFLFSYGKAETDFDLINSSTSATATGTMDGNVTTVGYGMRLQKGNRMELNYSFFDPSSEDTDFVSKVHMISLRYLFEGAPAPKR